LRIYTAQIQTLRPAFSQADWAHVQLLAASESSKHTPAEAKKEDKDTFFRIAMDQVEEKIKDKGSLQYRKALSIVNQRAYGTSVTKDDLKIEKIGQFLNEVMTESGTSVRETTITGGEGFFADVVFSVPTGMLPSYYDNPKSLPREYKAENLRIASIDDVNKVSSAGITLLSSISKQDQLRAQMLMQTLGDYDDARARAARANGGREASDSAVWNLMIDDQRQRVTAADAVRNEKKKPGTWSTYSSGRLFN